MSHFAEIVAALKPRRWVWSGQALIERWLPHRVTSVMPPSFRAAIKRMSQWPKRQALVAAAVAAELALPVWEESVCAVVPVKRTPRQGLAVLEAWLHGEATEADCAVATSELTAGREAVLKARLFHESAFEAHAAVVCAVRGASKIEGQRAVWDAESAVHALVSAVAIPKPLEVEQQLLAQWWTLVACRLAFADAEVAELG